jgi:uncharacterized membrane protein YqjE
MPFDSSVGRRRVRGLLQALSRLSETLTAILEQRFSRAAGWYRMELRRVAFVFALALAAALLAFASLTFLALTVMVAFWPTHPVVASASIAIAFAALALAAAALVRDRTSAAQSAQREASTS